MHDPFRHPFEIERIEENGNVRIHPVVDADGSHYYYLSPGKYVEQNKAQCDAVDEHERNRAGFGW